MSLASSAQRNDREQPAQKLGAANGMSVEIVPESQRDATGVVARISPLSRGDGVREADSLVEDQRRATGLAQATAILRSVGTSAVESGRLVVNAILGSNPQTISDEQLSGIGHRIADVFGRQTGLAVTQVERGLRSVAEIGTELLIEGASRVANGVQSLNALVRRGASAVSDAIGELRDGYRVVRYPSVVQDPAPQSVVALLPAAQSSQLMHRPSDLARISTVSGLVRYETGGPNSGGSAVLTVFRPELNSNRSEVVPEKSFVRQMIDNARYYTGAALQGLHNFASNLKEVAGALTSNPLVSAPLKVAGFFVNRVTDIPLVGDLWRIPRALAEGNKSEFGRRVADIALLGLCTAAAVPLFAMGPAGGVFGAIFVVKAAQVVFNRQVYESKLRGERIANLPRRAESAFDALMNRISPNVVELVPQKIPPPNIARGLNHIFERATKMANRDDAIQEAREGTKKMMEVIRNSNKWDELLAEARAQARSKLAGDRDEIASILADGGKPTREQRNLADHFVKAMNGERAYGGVNTKIHAELEKRVDEAVQSKLTSLVDTLISSIATREELGRDEDGAEPIDPEIIAAAREGIGA